MLVENRQLPDDLPVIEMSPLLKPVWEIHENHRCPVVGTCLTAEEHKKVARKAGFRIKGLKPFEIHSIIMSHMGNDNPVSRRVESFLKHKYRGELEQMREWGEEHLASEWRLRYATGDIGALLFYIALRRDLSFNFLTLVFGEVHMLSHAIIEKVSNATQQITSLSGDVSSLSRQLQESKKQVRRLMRENRQMLKEMDAGRHEQRNNTQQEPQHAVFSGIKPDCAEKKALEKKNNQLMWRIGKLESEKYELQKTVKEHAALNVHLRRDIEELISHFASLEELDSDATGRNGKPDLSSQRILIVGGMTKIRHLYQHLVESNGGHFDYHDGYLRNGNNNLDAKVNRADLILCPVNCNSHNACLKVKKLCGKYNKPLKILSNASVSTLSTALFKREAHLPAVEPAGTCSCGLVHCRA